MRAKARIGLGWVAVKLLQRDRALEAFQDVLYGTPKVLRPGEQMDPLLLQEAGEAAGKLLEEMGRWEQAARVYERLGRELVPFKAVYDGKAAKAREMGR